MTLLKEIFGLTCVVVFAVYINRVLTFYGFKRDPAITHKEMAIEGLNCEIIDPFGEENWQYENGLKVSGMYVGEDLMFFTTSNIGSIFMVDLTEDLTDYNLPLFEETKLLEYEREKTFGAISGFQRLGDYSQSRNEIAKIWRFAYFSLTSQKKFRFLYLFQSSRL